MGMACVPSLSRETRLIAILLGRKESARVRKKCLVCGLHLSTFVSKDTNKGEAKAWRPHSG